jgi:hypothetical protein
VFCGFIKRPAPKGNSIAGGSQKLQKQTGQVAQKIDPPVSSFGCHPSQGPESDSWQQSYRRNHGLTPANIPR